ncbi:MAG: stage 0 sporulation protein, partial [Bacilli bacterium]
MINVVEIMFEEEGHIYYFSPAGFVLEKNDNVIVETERGLQFGKVALQNTKVKKESLNLPLKNVVRLASIED